MDKHLYPGTQFRSTAQNVGGFPYEATVIEARPAPHGNLLRVKISDHAKSELNWGLQDVIDRLESGDYEFILDDFTRGYIECALWAESDQDDNAEREAREAGYDVQKVDGKYAVFLKGERVDEDLFEYEGSEDGAWWHAYKLSGGGSCPDAALENNYDESDIAPSALKDIIQDCLDFQVSQKELLADYYIQRETDGEGTVQEYAGHDLWLSRNGHGVGYFNRGLGELGDKLQDAAEVYGSSTIYVGDDKKLYVM